jgi:hypothetical protein
MNAVDVADTLGKACLSIDGVSRLLTHMACSSERASDAELETLARVLSLTWDELNGLVETASEELAAQREAGKTGGGT